MRVGSVHASPAEMIAEPGGLGAVNQCLQAAKMLGIGRGDGAEVHGDAMLDDSILFEDSIERGQWTAGIDHEVFRDDLEPVHDRLAGEDVLVVRNAETDSDAVILVRIETIAGHGAPRDAVHR